MEKVNAIKLLLVDDDVATRELYAEVFREAQFEVREAGDGLEALEMAHQIVPDIVLTGIIMPRMDGFQLVEALRKNVPTASVPVVFLSHLGREEDERRAHEIGVKDFLVTGMLSPVEAVKRIKGIVQGNEFMLNFDPHSLDAERFAKILGLEENLQSPDGGKWVLKLRLKDADKKLFDAEVVSL